MTTKTTQASKRAPLGTADPQSLTGLIDMAREIGATRTELIRGAIRVMIYYVDPDEDDPEMTIFFDELEIDLGDQPHQILIATFPETAAIALSGSEEAG